MLRMDERNDYSRQFIVIGSELLIHKDFTREELNAFLSDHPEVQKIEVGVAIETELGVSPHCFGYLRDACRSFELKVKTLEGKQDRTEEDINKARAGFARNLGRIIRSNLVTVLTVDVSLQTPKEDHFKPIFAALRENTSLEFASFSRRLSEAAAKGLADALEHNETLKLLNLTSLTLYGATCIRDALRLNTTLLIVNAALQNQYSRVAPENKIADEISRLLTRNKYLNDCKMPEESWLTETNLSQILRNVKRQNREGSSFTLSHIKTNDDELKLVWELLTHPHLDITKKQAVAERFVRHVKDRQALFLMLNSEMQRVKSQAQTMQEDKPVVGSRISTRRASN